MLTEQHPPTGERFPATGPGSMPTLWTRVAARLFDRLIVTVPTIAIAIPYIDPNRGPDHLLDVPRWVEIVTVTFPLVYEFVFLALVNATPGKLLFGIRVRRFVDGGRLAPYQAGLRVLIPGLGGVLGLLVTKGSTNALTLESLGMFMYVTAVVHPYRRGLHDLAAGSIVLRKD